MATKTQFANGDRVMWTRERHPDGKIDKWHGTQGTVADARPGTSVGVKWDSERGKVDYSPVAYLAKI